MSLTDPFRLAVMKALAEQIGTLVDGNDPYHFDLSAEGASLYGRATYGSNDPATMCNMVEDPREQPPGEATVPGKGHSVKWKLLLQGLTDDDPAEPTGPAYRLAADLQQAVAVIASDAYGQSDTVLGSTRKTNRVEQITIGAPVVRPPDEFIAKTYCIIPLTLDLFETPAAPFT